MNLEEAKTILNSAEKMELRDHAFGDCEIVWTEGSNQVAHGYFSGQEHSVSMSVCKAVFEGSEADELRECFSSEKVERNDVMGPEDFEIGRVMPGLTKQNVFEELTKPPKEA